MPLYRHQLPQLAGDIFLTDAGVETDLIFNHAIDIRAFAAHTLLPERHGRAALEHYFDGFLKLADRLDVGFVLDTVTWKAHRHWADELGTDVQSLAEANREAVAFIENLRNAAPNRKPLVLSATLGPRGDAYRPDVLIETAAAADYYTEQLGWLAPTDIDVITGLTFNQSSEAAGLVRACEAVALPAVVSFTTETDGRLPNGETLQAAIESVDEVTNGGAAYFMVNCAHPDHFADVLTDAGWARRIRGLRCNASRCSHAELDEAEELDDGNPGELAAAYADLRDRLPWLNVFGACCGADLRHVTAIGTKLAA
ncbi:MAG: homocysteine S-methyltransferase family protein [Pacificimonas sp.]